MPAGKERRDEEVWNDDQEIRRKDRSMADCLCAAAWRHPGAGVIVRFCEAGLRERDFGIRSAGGFRKFAGGAGGRGKRRSDAEREKLLNNSASFQQDYIALIQDSEFLEAITMGTGRIASVRLRHNKFREIVRKAIEV